AAADFAFDADPATHQIDQPGADGQAEAGALVAAGGRRIDLRKFLEYALQLVGGDADAGILDTHPEMDDAVHGLAGQVDQDVALFGKLYGVAEQIGNDLAEAPGIADNHRRQIRIDAHDQ